MLLLLPEFKVSILPKVRFIKKLPITFKQFLLMDLTLK